MRDCGPDVQAEVAKFWAWQFSVVQSGQFPTHGYYGEELSRGKEPWGRTHVLRIQRRHVQNRAPRVRGSPPWSRSAVLQP
eukprot:554587-Alexandrium_andersonii.AAC.1